ncbi:ferritin-like domain-containing protein [Sporolactobacillus sp. STCC-11]|uniref:ferritin family protein n=1 Tax=Sporolactobacillus caesalpiniae TaxID=3230362 RepID=UPI003394200A
MYYDDQHYRQISQGGDTSFASAVLDAVKGEATAVDFYGRLAEAAPNAEMRADILSIRQDEHDHFQLFSWLYAQLTGNQPVFQITPVQFRSFSEGLRIAYRDELEDYETYRNLYLTHSDPTVRNILLRAFSDEIKHAIRFGFMTTNLA